MNFIPGNVKLTSPDELFKKVPKSTAQSGGLVLNPQALNKLTENTKPAALQDNDLLRKKNDSVLLSTPFGQPQKQVLASLPLGFGDNLLAPDDKIAKIITPATNLTTNSNATLKGIPTRPPSPVRSADFFKSIKFMTTEERDQIISKEIVSGSEFIELTKNMSGEKREQAILTQILKGNVPDFIRNMKEVKVSVIGTDKKEHIGILKVIPDYLAIGSDKDFVRMPMNPLTAQKIANQTGTILPTRKIVNDIYQQAEVKISFSPMDYKGPMESNDYYKRNNQFIEDKMAEAGGVNGKLVAGQKKDVVLSNLLDTDKGKVAIYGWFTDNAKKIQPEDNKKFNVNGIRVQPLSTIHENTYADYSHGIRLIQGKMTVDGVERDVAAVLQDPKLAGLLCDEPGGVIYTPSINLGKNK